MLTSDWLRFVPPNGIIPLNAECASICADGLELADDAARTDIESFCRATAPAPAYWWDTLSVDGEELEIVEKAVRYLTARGRIRLEPSCPWLVTFEGVA